MGRIGKTDLSGIRVCSGIEGVLWVLLVITGKSVRPSV